MLCVHHVRQEVQAVSKYTQGDRVAEARPRVYGDGARHAQRSMAQQPAVSPDLAAGVAADSTDFANSQRARSGGCVEIGVRMLTLKDLRSKPAHFGDQPQETGET